MYSRRFSIETATAEVSGELDDDFQFEDTGVDNSSVLRQTFSEEPMYTFPQLQSTPTSSGATVSSSRIGSRPDDSELLSLMRQVVSGQKMLTSQVADIQERLSAVESNLSTMQSDFSRKEETTNRVDPELTVSHASL